MADVTATFIERLEGTAEFRVRSPNRYSGTQIWGNVMPSHDGGLEIRDTSRVQLGRLLEPFRRGFAQAQREGRLSGCPLPGLVVEITFKVFSSATDEEMEAMGRAAFFAFEPATITVIEPANFVTLFVPDDDTTAITLMRGFGEELYVSPSDPCTLTHSTQLMTECRYWVPQREMARVQSQLKEQSPSAILVSVEPADAVPVPPELVEPLLAKAKASGAK